MADTPATPLRAKVDECIADAARPHPWLAKAIATGEIPTAAEMDRIGAAAAINALFSVLGGVVSALDGLAAEIERQDAEIERH